jgi:hypothetical protein
MAVKLDQEAEAYRARLQRDIEQGSKIEGLYALENFQFYLGWIDRVRKELADVILRGKETDEKKDWHNRGGYDYLTKIIEGAESFGKKAKKARLTLEKFEKDVEAIPEAMKRAD